MEMTLGLSVPFNLDLTLCCGQVFRWNKLGEWWYGVVGEDVIKIRQVGERIEFVSVDEKFVKNYFGLNDDLQQIFAKICVDQYIESAVKAAMGLRIIRQEPWECLASYICATYKNILAVKKMLANLSRKFGGKTRFEGIDFYTFPTSKEIARTAIIELEECGLGYRAKYLQNTAKIICENKFDFEHLKKLNYEEARQELLTFPGVGYKVADCVLLFAFGKLEAFPVDVWVKRAILKFYANHLPQKLVSKLANKKSPTPQEYKTLNIFGRNYFGEYAGYAQEYLYHYVRTRG